MAEFLFDASVVAMTIVIVLMDIRLNRLQRRVEALEAMTADPPPSRPRPGLWTP